ncbi:hypothetical protein BBP40_010933 [Aspergillus hancockii]|nr:hypothetical protein BBP40_010933 [Aspergillus hancockii]
MADATPEKACQVVDELRYRNGGISDEERAVTPAGVLRALESVRRQLSEHFMTTSVCSKNTDFIFELVACTKEFSYKWAKDREETPRLEFTACPDRIIVESNDDGCTADDVRMLCEVKQTSREKVNWINNNCITKAFKIAWKVQVQSRFFSFSFRHRNGDDALGMVTPINETREALPKNVRTRLTLFLKQPERFSELVKELTEILNKGFMLFGSECEMFAFNIRPAEGEPARIIYAVHDHGGSLARIRTTNGEEVRDRYLIAAYKAGPHTSAAHLCFPLDEDNEPVLRAQNVYQMIGACAIPICQVGFNFAICAMFITNEERTAIDSNANKGVFGVALDALRQVLISNDVKIFSQNRGVAYIPRPDAVNQGLQKLSQDLYKRLEQSRAFRSEKGTQKSLSDLRYLAPNHCDLSGGPLFEDLEDDLYLSRQYKKHLVFLKPLGLQMISDQQLLERLKPYLIGLAPRIREPYLNDDWHERVSQLLISWLETGMNGHLATEVKELPLLPLSNGSWMRSIDIPTDSMPIGQSPTANSRIYFPADTEGNAIPNCLSMLTVAPEAARNNIRRKLFTLLGVKHAEPQLVVDRIKVFSHRLFYRPTADESMQILKYLYCVHAKSKDIKLPCFHILDQNGVPFSVTKCCPPFLSLFKSGPDSPDLHFRTNGGYGTMELARKLNGHKTDSVAFREPFLRLLHPIYLVSKPTGENDTLDQWIKWLEEVALVRRVPRLRHRHDSDRLSSLFEAILNHSPVILLGLLKTHWDTYEKQMTPGIVLKLQQAVVPTLNGHTKLEQSYLPVSELKKIYSEVLEPATGPTFFTLPFLTGLEDVGAGKDSGWDFLRTFGAGGDATVAFFRDIQSKLQSMHLKDRKAAYFRLYELLTERPLDTIRAFFGGATVWIQTSSEIAKLVYLSMCLWDGPPGLRTSYVLSSYDEYANNHKMKYLFKDMLGIGDAHWKTYIQELAYLKAGETNSDVVETLYKAILHDVEDEDTWKAIRKHMNESNLVYEPQWKGWYSLQQCSWAPSSMCDKIGISKAYPDLERLFVHKLHIEVPSLKTYISHIKYLSSKPILKVDEVVTVMHNTNHFCPTESALKPLKYVKFLPIKGLDDKLYYGCTTEDFFVVDREGWPLLFLGNVPTLSMTLADIQKLKLLLSSLGLHKQFISTAAVKTSFVSPRSTSISLELTREFRQKATLFSRCAVHFSDGKIEAIQEVYNTSRQARVYECENIVAKYTLELQSGSKVSVEAKSRLHMEYSNGQLDLFVPRDPKERHICYSAQLPEALMGALSITNPTARGTLATILREPLEVSESILVDDGIPELPHSTSFSLPSLDTVHSDDEQQEFFTPHASVSHWGEDDTKPSCGRDLELSLQLKDIPNGEDLESKK